jgi:hypothetical protein
MKREFDVADARTLAEQVLADLGDAPDLFGVNAEATNAEAALAAFEEPVAAGV